MRLVRGRSFIGGTLHGAWCIGALSLFASGAWGDETVRLRMNLQPGMAWNLETTINTQMQINAEAPGGQARQIQQESTQIRKGTMQVLAARNGGITGMKVSFDPGCEDTAQTQGQPPQKAPYALAGKTVNVKAAPDGSLATDLDTQPNEQIMSDLRALMNPDAGFFPPKPVAVGAGWDADARGLAQSLGLSPQDKVAGKCKLLKIRDEKGRQVADVALTIHVQKQGPMQMQMTLGGVSVVDVASGHVTQGDLIGSLKVSGQQREQGANGQIIPVAVSGNGKMEMHVKDPFITAGGPSTLGYVPPSSQPALSNGGVRMAGTFKDQRLTINLNRVSEGRYAGTIEMGDKKCPLTATAKGNQLSGTFQSGAKSFSFSALLGGNILTLTTGSTTYKLEKQEDNPFDVGNPPENKESDNPFSPGGAPPSDQPATPAPPPDGSDSSSPGPQGSTGEQGNSSVNAHAMRFVQFSLRDDKIIPGEAARLLIPAGWKVEGGIEWRANPVTPATTHMTIYNPDGLEQATRFPDIPFTWAEAGIAFFPIGTQYLGNEVLPPILEPAPYIAKIILPRFRGDVNAKVVSKQELPELAKAVSANNEGQSGPLTFGCRAGKVRIEYRQDGRPVEEDIYCVLLSSYSPLLHTSWWGTERAYGYRAEKGKLDEDTRLFQTIFDSCRPNLDWFNRYTQLTEMLENLQLQQIHEAGELSKYIAKTHSEISDTIRQSYEKRVATMERTNHDFDQVIRGVQDYSDPVLHERMELPAGYATAWKNGLGEVILTDNVNYDPNAQHNPSPGRSWHQLQQAH